jgi:diguanylate cyclase (GGDEF)-like protein
LPGFPAERRKTRPRNNRHREKASRIVEPPRLKILIVDDDPAILRMISTIVSAIGHEVSTSLDGREALDAILADCPDMVISDWDMPQMDGLELCGRIRGENLPHYLYVILLTAKSRVDDIVRGLDAGADDFLSKPILSTVLKARVRAGARMLEMERQLQQLSQHDPLTGAVNRRNLARLLHQEWERAARNDHPLSCAMLDLDFFKKVNDTHGHSAGDAVLQLVAGVLMDSCRTADVVCRYGGEEFCVLLPETDEKGAADWAERVRKAIADTGIPANGRSFHVTASIGVAGRIGRADNAESLIDAADQALRVAKETGRDRVVNFSSLGDFIADLAGNHDASGPLDGVLASDVMAPATFCPTHDDTVQHVADFFLQLRLESAPVVDNQGLLVGIVSVTELMILTASGHGWDHRIGEVMKGSVICYDEDTPVKEILEFLSRVSVPRVIVVEMGCPVGIISRDHLLRWFRNWMTVNQQRQLTDGRAAPAVESDARQAAITRITETLIECAAEIPRRLAEQPEDFTPCVVGEATRLQQLIDDLLAHCQTVQIT